MRAAWSPVTRWSWYPDHPEAAAPSPAPAPPGPLLLRRIERRRFHAHLRHLLRLLRQAIGPCKHCGPVDRHDPVVGQRLELEQLGVDLAAEVVEHVAAAMIAAELRVEPPLSHAVEADPRAVGGALGVHRDLGVQAAL